MPRIKTRDGTELYVKIWGEGRPVILMHGWPLSADSFDDQAIAEAGFQAIACDRRGFGRSDQPWSGYDYDTLSDDLADVMAACSAADATLVGFSMGGGEVARYMSRHGGKGVSQGVLISSVVPYMPKTDDNPNGTPAATFDKMTQGMNKDRAHFFASFFNDFYGMGLLQSPVSAELVESSCDVVLQAGRKPTLACAKAFATTDFRPDLKSFTVATLIIHGTADKAVPIDAAGRAAAAGIKNSRLIEYDGAPHCLLATHKEHVTRELLAFLTR